MSSQAYVGTAKRTFQQAFMHEMETNYGFLNSQGMLKFLAQDVQRLVEEFYPAPTRISSGWMLFTGTKVDQTKAFPGQSASDHTTLTIPWPVLLPEDIQAMTKPPNNKEKRWSLLQHRVIRLIEHGLAHPDGPITLTQADLALMLGITHEQVCLLLKDARLDSGKPLPTKGYFFDQGLRPTHKAQIIQLYEQGVDEADIALRTQHSPTSVGNYIRGYERVMALVKRSTPISTIAYLLNMQIDLVHQYIQLLRIYQHDLLPFLDSPDLGA
ncbi:MAG: DUF1670 domain-containing protein [Caldilineaceae bacterium]